MKIIRNIFIGFGCIFALFVVFLVFMGYKSAGFKDEYAPFVTKFMTEFSAHWEVGDVQHMLASDFKEQLETPNARQALAMFRQLGRVTSIGDMELNNFQTHAGTDSYKLGEFVFKADFEHASGLVNITVIVNKDGERVQGLYINPTTAINRVPAEVSI